MIKTPVSCTKLKQSTPCWGNTFPSFCGPHMLLKITWLLNCVASTLSDQYQVLSLRSFTGKSLRMQKSFSQKPYTHSSNQEVVLSNNAVPDVFSIYEILELEQSSRNYLQKVDLEKQIQITDYYLIAKQMTVHSKKE